MISSTSNTQTSGKVPEPILVKNGQSDYDYYVAQFNQFASQLNRFGEKVESELPDLKIKFNQEWFMAFRNGWAENRISKKIDDFAKTQPHSLREYVTNWHWERLNKITEEAGHLFNKFQRFVTPDMRSYPYEAIKAENMPFDENGKMVLTDEFKAKIRPLFNTYAEGEHALQSLELMQRIADVYNEISTRISEGKTHPNYRHTNLQGSKPEFITLEANGKYAPNANYLNTL